MTKEQIAEPKRPLKIDLPLEETLAAIMQVKPPDRSTSQSSAAKKKAKKKGKK